MTTDRVRTDTGDWVIVLLSIESLLVYPDLDHALVSELIEGYRPDAILWDIESGLELGQMPSVITLQDIHPGP